MGSSEQLKDLKRVQFGNKMQMNHYTKTPSRFLHSVIFNPLRFRIITFSISTPLTLPLECSNCMKMKTCVSVVTVEIIQLMFLLAEEIRESDV